MTATQEDKFEMLAWIIKSSCNNNAKIGSNLKDQITKFESAHFSRLAIKLKAFHQLCLVQNMFLGYFHYLLNFKAGKNIKLKFTSSLKIKYDVKYHSLNL